jgi:hypothetical protein
MQGVQAEKSEKGANPDTPNRDIASLRDMKGPPANTTEISTLCLLFNSPTVVSCVIVVSTKKTRYRHPLP